MYGHRKAQRRAYWFVVWPVVLSLVAFVLLAGYVGNTTDLDHWARNAPLQQTKVEYTSWQTLRGLLPADMQDASLDTAVEILNKRTGKNLGQVQRNETILLPIPYGQWLEQKSRGPFSLFTPK